jgi:hypothetical protein
VTGAGDAGGQHDGDRELCHQAGRTLHGDAAERRKPSTGGDDISGHGCS